MCVKSGLGYNINLMLCLPKFCGPFLKMLYNEAKRKEAVFPLILLDLLY